ncbi:zinc finger protein 449 [Centroberyx affinis]|uniref:zinc finger protein 449 n=1 Tax=Centroberyx affinis TaxID=166261 RepID=UPI003A5C3AF9
MADCSSRVLVNADSVPTMYSRDKPFSVESAERPVGRGGTAGTRPSSSATVENRNWDSLGGMDQITVVRIDDSHIAGLQAQLGEKGKDEGAGVSCYEVEYSMPMEEEREMCTATEIDEEEEEGVYVIEYSNPEEEGESYQFKMSVDKQLPTKQQMKRPVSGEHFRTPLDQRTGSKDERKQRKNLNRKKEAASFSCSLCGAVFHSSESLSQHEAEHSDDTDPKKASLVCTLCPPPGRRFKKMSGFAVHLKLMHYKEGRKNFFCTMCKKPVRSQFDLDAHTRRHANQEAVFECVLCRLAPPGDSETGRQGYRGTKWGLRKHLEAEHPGVIPRCDICDKSFKTVPSYLSDQFRHVGVSPFYCSKCKIYEMTERGLLVHLRNHNLKEEKQKGEWEAERPGGNAPLSESLASSAENSATDDSDS